MHPVHPSHLLPCVHYHQCRWAACPAAPPSFWRISRLLRLAPSGSPGGRVSRLRTPRGHIWSGHAANTGVLPRLPASILRKCLINLYL
jgi:hypothetical protein